MANVSDTFVRVDINQYPRLCNAAEVLSKLAYDGYEIVILPNGRVGFLCKFIVDVGTSSLLKRLEPIIIAVDADDVERTCPQVYPDRQDFPFDRLPHINYPHGNMPPSLCLSRESAEEWYSEISFEQFILTLIEWLSDAANNRLIKLRNNDEYEPFRVPETNALLLWYHEMDYFVEHSKKFGCAFHDVHYENNVGTVIYGSRKGNERGLVAHLSRPQNIIEYNWFVNVPKTVDNLYEILNLYGFVIDCKSLAEIVNTSSSICTIYVAFSVLRPTKIIGKLNRVDTICFKFSADAIRNSDKSLAVEPVILYDQTTPIFASNLSKTDYELTRKNVLILGAGAVGSKLIDHLYRAGICNLTICDNDSFLPHNVIRHTLSSGISFDKKVNLIKRHLEKMFMLPKSVEAIDDDAVSFLHKEDLSKFDLIVDATASSRVLYALDEIDFKGVIIRVCLSNEGSVGMTYVKRNADVHLQEYYMEILRLSFENDDIRKWIVSDTRTTLDRVRVGEGCHSNTMKVSDDSISEHTAISSRVIKNVNSPVENGNELYLSFADYDYPGSMYTEKYFMPKFVTLPSDNAEWTIRVPEDLLKEFHIKTKTSGSNEIGGYLVGLVSNKRKVIYVLGHHVPRDSSRKPTELRLGTSGLKEFLSTWSKKTGGQVKYLGDWHSHPKGSVIRSSRDETTFKNIKPELDGLGVCIITNGHQEKAYIV